MIKLTQEEQQYLLNSIRIIPDFPKKGIIFRDITTLLNNKEVLNFLLNHLEKRYKNYELDFIAGTESRGFIFASMLCAKLNLPFVPIRKPGKLPFETFSCTYDLEYGSDKLELHKDAFKNIKNAKVLLIDDLIATGGTAIASHELIHKTGAKCVEACFLINLKDLNGANKLEKLTSVYSVLKI
ncbi:adenine phosphoribosyltransferase [Campylobacter hepaticus]|uniref:Adenine phosphoribosyltransferase n=1 Tax=Campylobacter hepaticus TaxID=1813019 RepID=A0A6A7JU57_9BACT|nr:adenine phosphoribosyltransferase [Campylobacter hepaticus]AXP08551.1 adenine phosphoribosyltransferase [Campylobacter hepaticus]MCZ0772390.1 adenine phosphoribosyltransferase [Campylobacter hepaticus]MCZ0773858.1 adenine phosphoribosyltransferase [Campylobacter hepaticus]MCZ0775109.1 adenine phosphoribosyltransferase [Campylobacter hepaticus]MDX2323946.1 adenine phosphoribosyltransferase [Campylobacter hepaticus]